MLRVGSQPLRWIQGKLPSKKGIWLPMCSILINQNAFHQTNGSTQVRWMCQAGASHSDKHIMRSLFSDVPIPTLPYAKFLWENLKEFGDRPALTCGLSGRSYTYEMVQTRARNLGYALNKRGMQKGDVLGIVSPNSPEFPIALVGAISMGGIVSPVNPTYTVDEITRQFQSCRAKFVVTAPSAAEKVKEAVSHCPLVKEIFVSGEAEGLTPLALLTTGSGDVKPEVPNINVAEDVALLPYSSGTTGLPKGVMLTHQNLTTNIMQASSPEMINHPTPSDTIVAILPMFHIFAMTFFIGTGLRHGAHIVTLPQFEPETFLKALHKYKPTIMHLVPPLLNFLAFHKDVNVEDLQQLHTILCGAAPVSKAVVTSFKERVQRDSVIFQEGYGLTEASPTCILTPKTSGRIGTCGAIMPNTEAKVVDVKTGKSLGVHSAGELCIRGPQVMKGYLNNPKATQETIDEDGWLHTGDIALYDEDGFFQVVDRLKELIKVKGYQVAPSELEDLLLSHPDVVDVAVIGMPDDIAGELPRAYIVLSSHVTKEDINNFVNAKVAPYKQLKGGVEFVKSIPKTPTGKILRRVLKEQALSKV